MSMWTAIALISVAAIIAGIFGEKGKKKNSDKVERDLDAVHARIDALEKDLRERVETLERIVTNPKEDLKRQFEDLDKVS